MIGPQAVRRQHEDVVHPVIFFEALIEQLGIGVERYALIADEHVIVRRAVAVQNLFDAGLIFSVILNSEKGDQRFLRQGVVILHISVAHVKQKAGQEKRAQRDEQHKRYPVRAGLGSVRKKVMPSAHYLFSEKHGGPCILNRRS